MLSMTGPKRPWMAAAGLPMLIAVFGCGNTYRPVVTPISPTGPAPQSGALVAVLSVPSSGGAVSPGMATIVDFSGDSILAQAFVGPSPSGFGPDVSGGFGYTMNSDGSVSQFQINSTLRTKDVQTTSLLPGSTPINVLSLAGVEYLADPGKNAIDVLQGSPQAQQQAIPVGPGPITLAGSPGAQRVYAISQNVALDSVNPVNNTLIPGPCSNPSSVSMPGQVASIEVATNTVSSTIPVGVCPVFGLSSADNRRTFILNRGSGTITVIDSQKNQFMQTIPVGAGPVYAEIYSQSSLLVTANYDSNTVSVIDVGLDIYGNNSPTFGKVLATIPVGVHPAAVTVLQDGSRAYVANESDGTVSVVDLVSFRVKKIIPVPATPHPRFIASITNPLLSKVYLIDDSAPLVTILRTDVDVVSATVRVPGNIVELHVQKQSADGANSMNVSRARGSGVP